MKPVARRLFYYFKKHENSPTSLVDFKNFSGGDTPVLREKSKEEGMRGSTPGKMYTPDINSEIYPWKELTGLSRTDDKRPDGMPLIPWLNGKSVVWDVTVYNTMEESYIATSSQLTGRS